MSLSPADYDRMLTFYRERVASYGAGDAWRAGWSQWCRRLLSFGGDLVVPHWGPEPHLERLLAGAATASGDVTMIQGRPNGCHDNAALLWLLGTADAIGTGYALSDDGLWRQHSWGVDGDGRVIETTCPRVRYVGVTLAGQDALEFVGSQLGPEEVGDLAARPDRLAALLTLPATAG
jgi:hypothetical protein